MRLVLIAMLATGVGAFAQHSGGHAAGGGGGFRGSGAGRGGGGRYTVPPRVAHVHSGTTIVPYPVFYGGYYYYDPALTGTGLAEQPASDNGYYGNGYNSGYSAGYSNDSGAPAQSPVVIINQSFRPETANPVMRDYSNTTLPPPGPMPESNLQPDDQATIYLIAMKDHTIFPTVAYWVEGDTLNYITAEGSQNRASMALVDREFSKQLNDERHVEFKLPAAK
jgi:hypothetical protein